MTTIQQAFESIEHTQTSLGSTSSPDTPQIYVACLAAYNNGYLHGKWIECTQSADDIREEIAEMLKESPVTKLYGEIAEEWAIHDYQGFEGYNVSEWEDIEKLAELAEAMSNSDDPEMFTELLEIRGHSIEEAKEFLEENYRGLHTDLADYAEELHNDCYEPVPKHLQYYIDWERMGRDMEMSGEIFTITTSLGMHVFYNN